MIDRIEQLIPLIIFGGFLLLDFIMRRIRQRTQGGAPPDMRDEEIDERDYDENPYRNEPVVLDDDRVPLPLPVPQDPPPPRPQPTAPPPPRPAPVARTKPIVKPAERMQLPEVTMIPVPRASRSSTARKRLIGKGMLDPIDARRGIVLMTILGPCRAYELEQQERAMLERSVR